MTPIVRIGKFTPIGMRARVEGGDALVINTCSGNDSNERGTPTSWTWSNPTNQRLIHYYKDVCAVSVECLWQGTKLLPGQKEPDQEILGGNWRKNKGKRPAGAYAGRDDQVGLLPLITSPGQARRAIYIPAFRHLIESWLEDPTVAGWVDAARNHPGAVFLRDHDTGRGLDRNGPMSHAWVLAVWLNTGSWPD